MPAELLSQPFLFKVELVISTVRTVLSISLGGSPTLYFNRVACMCVFVDYVTSTYARVDFSVQPQQGRMND